MAGDRKNIMLAIPFEERRLSLEKFGWRYPVIVQPKLDGERCRILGRGDDLPILLSSTEEEIISVPHINEAIRHINIGFHELDGELYCHGEEFADIHSVVSRKSLETIHPDADKIQFWMFDIVNTQPQLKRTATLIDFPIVKEIITVPNSFCNTFEEILEKFDSYLKQGFEGIIIRHIDAPYMRKRSRYMMKFKPKKTDHYQIVGVVEAVSKTGEFKNMIGAFICTSDEGTHFNVGAGQLKHEERIALWQRKEELIGRTCVVQYQNINPSGIPRFGLCVTII